MSKNDSLPAAGESFLLVYHADYPSYQRFIVGTEDAIPEVNNHWRINHETEHENCPGDDGLSAMAMGSTSAFAHGGHGMCSKMPRL